VSRQGSETPCGYGGAVRRNSYSLAALAAAAVPGLRPAQTVSIATPQDDLDVSGVVGEDGRRALVSCPCSTAAGIALEKSLRIGEALRTTPVAPLVPALLGSVPLSEGGRAAVTATPEGRPLLFDELVASQELIASLGEVLARVHSVPVPTAESAGVETFRAPAIRETRRKQFARAQEVEPLPAALVQRWQHALDDDALWDFTPVLTHSDLSEEGLFVRDGRISGFRDWATARVADPADDLAWLVSTLEPAQLDVLLRAYREHVATPPDPALAERAQTVGEFAVLEWLLHGVESENESIVEDARGMLKDLDADIAQLARDEAEEAYADLDAHDAGAASAPRGTDGSSQDDADVAATEAGPEDAPADVDGPHGTSTDEDGSWARPEQ
jgi:macrolide phosphotransferase